MCSCMHAADGIGRDDNDILYFYKLMVDACGLVKVVIVVV